LKLPRFYCESIQPDVVKLDKTQSHHLIDVLRITAETNVEVFDGKGQLAAAAVKDVKHKTATLEVQEIKTYPCRKDSRIVIAVSIPKGQRLDWMITKCTELGVDHIALVKFQRTVKQTKGSSALDRLNKLAVSAAKQSGRIFLPKIEISEQLPQTIACLKNQYPQSDLFFGQAAASAKIITQLPTDKRDKIVFIGPEGALTTEEQALLKDNDALPVTLTETILRIETAAIAFGAILCAHRL